MPDDTEDEAPVVVTRARARRAKDPLGPEIVTRLRELYSVVEREPIPMQLVDLLERLSEAERKAGR